MGGLGLDTREGILKGGKHGPALVEGKPEDSLLIKAIRKVDENLKMPPSGSLKDAEIAILTQWVQMGAPWGGAAQEKSAEKFWAFENPKKSTFPQVSKSDWVKSPVDVFILSGLEAKGLAPSAPADKRTLIRRATYDLIGLPPTAEEVQNFLEDNSPEAFRKVVDRLLASPHYGERWGRHWLDVARYADSNGMDENLVYKNAYRYRDYVINAFNQDKPYDQFVQEQLAGDLLPPSSDLKTTFERWTATGFLSLGAKMLAEDDPVKMEMDIVDEQLDTTARAFMGLTVGCARCHDHKFDPITHADYYSMAGIFRSSKTMENFKVVAKWHEYPLAPPDEVKKLRDHEEKVEKKQKEINQITGEENRKLSADERRKISSYLLASDDLMRYRKVQLQPLNNAKFETILESTAFEKGNPLRELKKGSSNVPPKTDGPFFAEYTITVSKPGDYQLDMLELEKGAGTADIHVNGLLIHPGAPPIENRAASPDEEGWAVIGVLPLKAGKNTLRLEHKGRFPYFEKLKVGTLSLPAGTPVPRSTVQVARQYGINPGFLVQLIDSLNRSKGAPSSVLFAWENYGQPMNGWVSPAAKLFEGFHPANKKDLAVRYEKLFLETIDQWQIREEQLKGAAKDSPNPEEKGKKNSGLENPAHEALREFLYEKAGVFRSPRDSRQYFPQEIQATLARLDKEHKVLADATPQLPSAMGITEGKIADLAIHLRGSHWTLGKTVPRQFLKVIAGEKQTPIGSNESGRLQLAKWITQPDHPLTSRVMVNRLWRWHFGRGIVPSVDNFGRLGEKPSNQPLLDWLAVEFVERGWSIKEMHRLMVLSSTYQMSSDRNEKAESTDPENILLWKMPRRRLEAEAVRDAVVTVAGNLDPAMGGSILDYKDRQYVSNTAKRGGVDYDRNLRAVYIPVVRSSMYEVFSAFDLPDPATSNGDRNSSVIAPQALFMMNSSLVLKNTRKMAEDMLNQQNIDDAARVRTAYERALSRPASAQEVDHALTFISQIDQVMRDRHPDDAERKILAWQSFCKALLGSNEFIYLN